MSGKTCVVLLAEGAEEMEVVITTSILRRGGITVTVAGLDGTEPVRCSRDVMIKPDMSLADAMTKRPYDAVALPGGLKGAENLGASPVVKELLVEMEKDGKLIGAICAASAISLNQCCVGQGKRMTTYPLVKDKLTSSGKYIHEDSRVVVDGQFVTSQAPGTAFDFALSLVEKLVGKETRDATAKFMLLS